MKRWLIKRWWLGLVLLEFVLLFPFSVSAVTAPDALAGLKEFFAFTLGLARIGTEFLLGLAGMAVEAFVEYLKAVL